MHQKILLTAMIVAAVAVGSFLLYRHYTNFPTAHVNAPVLSSEEAAQGTPGVLVNVATYECDGGKNIIAAYFKGKEASTTPGEPPKPTGIVELTFSDRASMTLHQTLSADGARYANADESYVFWGKGDSAMVQQNGSEKDYTNCAIHTPPATSSSSTPLLPKLPPLPPVPQMQ